MWREEKEGKGVMIRPKHRRNCKNGDVTKFHRKGRTECRGDAGRHEDKVQQVLERKRDSQAAVRTAEEDACLSARARMT